MHVQVQSWDEVSSETLARFLFEVRQREGLFSESMTLDNYIRQIEWLSDRMNSVPIVAYANREIVGWLAFFSFVPKIGTIGRWHPIIKVDSQKEVIATKLLKASIAYAKNNGFDRFEVELTGITTQTEVIAQQYQGWYRAEGLYISAEEARLERDLTQEPWLTPTIPPEFQLVSLSNYSNDELQAPFFEMFDNSHDRFWLDQTEDQRLETFRFWFDRDRPFVNEATRVLVNDEQVVGLTVVRPVQEVGMLGPIAVLPQFRRQGLGRALLAFSMQGILASGFSKVQLEFDITNDPAFKLYNLMGFQPVHRLKIFVLNLR